MTTDEDFIGCVRLVRSNAFFFISWALVACVVLSLPIILCQEVLQGKVGPPFHLEALREFTTAQLMDENIDFLLEVNITL